ncbi:MAG: hypothetical protein ACYSX0_04385 [Planctomycetota bacterium]
MPTRMFGTIMVFAGLFPLIRIYRRFTDRPWQVLLADTVASFNAVVSGGGHGPLGTGAECSVTDRCGP